MSLFNSVMHMVHILNYGEIELKILFANVTAIKCDNALYLNYLC